MFNIIQLGTIVQLLHFNIFIYLLITSCMCVRTCMTIRPIIDELIRSICLPCLKPLSRKCYQGNDFAHWLKVHTIFTTIIYERNQ